MTLLLVTMRIMTKILLTQPSSQLQFKSEPGVSCILTSLPLKELVFTMSWNKTGFHDDIAFRIKFKISGVSKLRVCNQMNYMNHSLTSTKRGYLAC